MSNKPFRVWTGEMPLAAAAPADQHAMDEEPAEYATLADALRPGDIVLAQSDAARAMHSAMQPPAFTHKMWVGEMPSN